jgi:Protein of unknown function (DUF4058)
VRPPFPGMGPFIESFGLWEDFHSKLIGEMERSLSSVVPDRYVVRTGERAYVSIGGPYRDKGHDFLPDVALASTRGPEARGRSDPTTPGADEPDTAPVMMQALFQAEYREVFLEIHQTDPTRRLVTGIELLSPSNKRGGTKGWRLYHRKRQVYLRGLANFVELDLLRRGRRMPMAGHWPVSAYLAVALSGRRRMVIHGFTHGVALAQARLLCARYWSGRIITYRLNAVMALRHHSIASGAWRSRCA